MRLTRLKNPIADQEIKVAANSCWSQAEALPNGYRCRWPIFKDRASYRITGAELIDFHNTIVS
jgi:hypothetical protein